MNETYIILLIVTLLNFLRSTIKNPGKSARLDKWLIEVRNFLLVWYPLEEVQSVKVLSKNAFASELKKLKA